MVKRKKRLERGIESLGKQIDLHKIKREKALEEDKIELAAYYTTEIEAKKRDLGKKKYLLNRKKKKNP